MQSNSGNPDQTPGSVASVWVCTVYICPKVDVMKRTLYLYGLSQSLKLDTLMQLE